MKLLAVVLCIFCGVRLYTSVRFCLKRRHMRQKLASLCGELGYDISFATKREIRISTQADQVIINVIGTASPRSRLVFCHDKTYRFERRVSIPLRFDICAVFPFASKVHSIEGECADILLVCPACGEVVIRGHDDQETHIGSSDEVFGVRLYSLSGLCERLCAGEDAKKC